MVSRASGTTCGTNPRQRFDMQELLSGARRGDLQSLGELLQQYRNYLMLLATTQIERRWQAAGQPVRHRAGDDAQGASPLCPVPRPNGAGVAGLAAADPGDAAWRQFVEQHMLAAKRDMRREVSIERCSLAPWRIRPSRLESMLAGGGRVAQRRRAATRRGAWCWPIGWPSCRRSTASARAAEHPRAFVRGNRRAAGSLAGRHAHAVAAGHREAARRVSESRASMIDNLIDHDLRSLAGVACGPPSRIAWRRSWMNTCWGWSAASRSRPKSFWPAIPTWPTGCADT